MCMAHRPTPDGATAAIAPAARKAFTSFTMAQPASIAWRITSGFIVSTDTAMPSRTRARTTGITRASSISSGTGSAPGRVDSPPTSTRSAPSEASARPCSMARASARNRPPSENESAVTFRTPITFGRSRARVKEPQRRVGIIKKNGAAEAAPEKKGSDPFFVSADMG